MAELHELNAADVAALVRDGEIRSVELVQSCLDRIAAREPTVGAWAWLDPERALDQARERDRQAPRGPLHGVPVAVKDIIDTADQGTTYGSVLYADHRPAIDAVCVQRLRRAGAVVLGKTVTTEFALFAPGKTANPLDPGRTPGGSSSGSAAAVADLMVPLALGTQTAGSVVRPAAFCGIFGLKPTFGSFDVTGVKAVSASLDTLGHFARTAEDLALLAGVLADEPGRFDIGGLDVIRTPRIGFARTAQWSRAEPATRARIEAAVAGLAASTEVKEVALPDEFAGLVEAQMTIMHREAAHALAEERERASDQLSDKLLEVLDAGDQISDAQYEAAQDLARRCRQRLPEVMADRDVLLAPAVTGEAPTGLESTGDPLFCRAWTLLGAPTVAVPGLTGPSALPLGVQVIALRGRDVTALAAAGWTAQGLSVEAGDRGASNSEAHGVQPEQR